MIEQPNSHPVNSSPQTNSLSRSLFDISEDIAKLNELLDELEDDQQQEFITNWLEQLGTERDRKLDNYSTLIVEMTSRATARKAEAQRLLELAQRDEKRANLLKERLKWFFTVHGLKTLETLRYRLSIVKNGGKAPVILKESFPAAQLPERFQKVSIEANTTAIREALEAGENLDFASLGDRGSNLRIK